MNNSVFIAMFLLLMGGVILLYAHKIEIKCLLKAVVIRFLNRGKGVKIAYSADVNIKKVCVCFILIVHLEGTLV